MDKEEIKVREEIKKLKRELKIHREKETHRKTNYPTPNLQVSCLDCFALSKTPVDKTNTTISVFCKKGKEIECFGNNIIPKGMLCEKFTPTLVQNKKHAVVVEFIIKSGKK